MSFKSSHLRFYVCKLLFFSPAENRRFVQDYDLGYFPFWNIPDNKNLLFYRFLALRASIRVLNENRGQDVLRKLNRVKTRRGSGSDISFFYFFTKLISYPGPDFPKCTWILSFKCRTDITIDEKDVNRPFSDSEARTIICVTPLTCEDEERGSDVNQWGEQSIQANTAARVCMLIEPLIWRSLNPAEEMPANWSHKSGIQTRLCQNSLWTTAKTKATANTSVNPTRL